MMSSNETVSEKMLELGKFPVLGPKDSLKKALDEMTNYRLGVACFTNADGNLIGILTDGDLRRLLLTRQNPLPALLITPAIEYGNMVPTSIHGDQSLGEASSLMHDKQIWDLPVINSEKKLIGLIHRHDVN